MKPMVERLKENEPYNLFFTTIADSPQTHNQKNSVTFTDLLCPSLGELKCSLQTTFIINGDWLMEQYSKAGQGAKPLTILYGSETVIFKEEEAVYPNVTHHYVQVEDPYGIHHPKMGIYVYKDNSVRVVVSTANLFYADWNDWNNGLWISPLCPALPEGNSEKDGESPTILINYLQQYKIEILGSWIEYVKRADFSNIKVFLITSVPGTHSMVSRHSHVHTVGGLLSKHCVLSTTSASNECASSWKIIIQSSSIGFYGQKAEWLRQILLRSLASHSFCRLPANSTERVSVIFPTKQNVLDSYDEVTAVHCLSYFKNQHEQQEWLKKLLHQWKADQTYRTRAMRHIKTYSRFSPCMTKLAWFLLSSANATRAAWGGFINKEGTIYVRNYEVGVLFLPRYFDETYFQVKATDDKNNEIRLFPVIYDLPLTPYESDDEPQCS